jgi:hypothetical protein
MPNWARQTTCGSFDRLVFTWLAGQTRSSVRTGVAGAANTIACAIAASGRCRMWRTRFTARNTYGQTRRYPFIAACLMPACRRRVICSTFDISTNCNRTQGSTHYPHAETLTIIVRDKIEQARAVCIFIRRSSVVLLLVRETSLEFRLTSRSADIVCRASSGFVFTRRTLRAWTAVWTGEARIAFAGT